jgi:hypothetical protein
MRILTLGTLFAAVLLRAQATYELGADSPQPNAERGAHEACPAAR